MVKSEGGQQVFQESKQRKHLSKYVRRWIIAVCAVVIVIGGFVTWRVVSGRNERQANQARVVDYFVRNYEGIETMNSLLIINNGLRGMSTPASELMEHPYALL